MAVKPTGIEHIGIAVRSLAEAVPAYEKILGVACSGIEEVADQGVRTAFFRFGQAKIELLEPITAEGPLARFIEKRGEGIHHIALALPDAGAALDDLAAAGVQVIDREPRRGAEGLAIGFLHPRSAHGALIELCSKPKKKPPGRPRAATARRSGEAPTPSEQPR